MAAEQIEIASLRGEIDELRGLIRADVPQGRNDDDAGDLLGSRDVRPRPIRDKSSVGWAKRVLQMAGGPMYVDEIIQNIAHLSGITIPKATLVSNLSRYVKAGKTFTRTGANTFGLLDYEDSEKEIRLVG